jgi:5'-3' exonuclease
MGLWREDLVAFAYFLGSDYAEGVNGVGIVNAVEIIRAFPMRAQPSDASSSSSSASSGEVRPGDDVAEGPLSGLRKFKEWLHGYDFEGEFFGKEDKAQRISSGEHQLLVSLD